jgi:cytochrome c oxidase assembly factor CtaG
VPIVEAHVGSGTWEPLQVAAPLLLGSAYALRARTLARQGRPVPAARQAAFASGVLLILLALVSPLAHVGGELLAVHMAQHLVLGDLAALLIVVGLTGPVLQPLLSVSAIDRLRVLANPLIAFPLWLADLILWHVPAVYEAAGAHPALHALEHACFIAFGILMWMPLFGPLPKPAWFGIGAKFGYVIGVRVVGGVLGNVLMWSGSVIYGSYAAGERYWGISPLSDQGLAGTIMMAEGSLVTLGLLVWLFFQAARQGEEKQRLLEMAEARGRPLDPARAERAVAAGQGARLAERLATDK